MSQYAATNITNRLSSIPELLRVIYTNPITKYLIYAIIQINFFVENLKENVKSVVNIYYNVEENLKYIYESQHKPPKIPNTIL